MKRYPRGSEWRKWDLHIHAPGGSYGDRYTRLADGTPDWDRFCEVIEHSDVRAIGITDYFSFDSFFDVVAAHKERYPDSRKVFFPNLELRLVEAVNSDGQSVNLHLILRPELTRPAATKLLSHLSTEIKVGGRRKVFCNELEKHQREAATVTRDSISSAITDVFGEAWSDNLVVLTAAAGDGIRPGGKGSKKRKAALVDEIDKFSHGFFGDHKSATHFLDRDRLDTDEKIEPKPVFAGCDAHSFEDLEAWLGQEVAVQGQQQHITWVKADPTFEGLQQTLVEPAERVRIDPTEPDLKEPYRFISEVRFPGSKVFPESVKFNRNLNAIIGSRSSGKSALLAFIAHTVDPEETVELQAEASGQLKREKLGPAAGKTWADVAAIDCEVEWGEPDAVGRVIYIPQNSLYAISNYPERITAKIQPALVRKYPDFGMRYDQLNADIDTSNAQIREEIETWFTRADRIDQHSRAIRDLGDKAAITATRDRIQMQVDELKIKSALTDEELEAYQAVIALKGEVESKVRSYDQDLARLEPYVDVAGSRSKAKPGAVTVEFSSRPRLDQLPDDLQDALGELLETGAAAAAKSMGKELAALHTELRSKREAIRTELDKSLIANRELIERNEANKALEKAIAEHKVQVDQLKRIDEAEKARKKLRAKQIATELEIRTAIGERDGLLDEIGDAFDREPRTLDTLTFGIEIDFDDDRIAELSAPFNKRDLGDYVLHDDQIIDIDRALADPGDLLKQLRRGTQRLNRDQDPETVAIDVLTAVREVRFSADLDGDIIGGFGLSSMTPGKQALFALTLLLNESDEPWPLLIDQPEDDLDSRSIYDTIVPYIVDRKRERQIIMVSHNANLVIGADSEELIVANRHGDDRKNVGGRYFDYFTGSLEHSASRPRASTILARHGIREHACEILDGGAEAFQKRKEKYKI
jgi:hypothetical protein